MSEQRKCRVPATLGAGRHFLVTSELHFPEPGEGPRKQNYAAAGSSFSETIFDVPSSPSVTP